MNDEQMKDEQIQKLKAENVNLKDWEYIARKKTDALKEFLPDYTPEFSACPDDEHIKDCLGRLKNSLIKEIKTRDLYFEEIKELKQEKEILKDLLQERIPQGCIAETTYQPILDENEQLKEEAEENKKLFDTTFGELMKLKEKSN